MANKYTVRRSDYNQIEESQGGADGEGASNESDGRLFPDPDKSNFKITGVQLTDEFLIFATDVSETEGKKVAQTIRGA